VPRSRKAEGGRWFALDFANTTTCPACQGTDAFANLRDARAWTRRNSPAEMGHLRANELAMLRRFRDQLVALLDSVADGSDPPSGALSSLNQAAGTPLPHPQLIRTSYGWKVGERGGEGRASLRLSALAARSVMDLLRGPSPEKIRRCLGPGCVHFLVDPMESQRWCSPTGCGNRARVQRHYRKLRARRQRPPGRVR